MQIIKPTYTVTCSECELKEALQHYMLHKYNKDITISSLKHNVGERTEGYGCTEIDIPYQEGLILEVEDN